MNWDTIFLILCSIGAIQSFFIGFYFVKTSPGRSNPNFLLGFLFLAIAVRVAKSTLWLFSQEVPEIVLNIGLGAHLAITPLLFLYLRALVPGSLWNHWNWLHFLPTVLVLATANLITGSNFWYLGGYSALLYQALIYLVFSGYQLSVLLKKSEVSQGRENWLKTIFISVAVFCLAYFANYELGLTSYMTGPVIYSAIIYYLSYYVLTHDTVFTGKVKTKYRNIQLGEADVRQYTDKVKRAVEGDQLFLQPDFTLSQLSERVDIPKHVLSHLFNMHLKVSFTDFTNRYRIEKALEYLADPAYDHHKISAIAYECGFNTLSAFNAAFKKNAGVTPSAYKKNPGQTANLSV